MTGSALKTVKTIQARRPRFVPLLREVPPYIYFADIAADPTTSGDGLRALGNTLGHSVGGTVVLLVILVLNIYKPQGMTQYGWRKQQKERRQQREKRSSLAP